MRQITEKELDQMKSPSACKHTMTKATFEKLQDSEHRDAVRELFYASFLGRNAVLFSTNNGETFETVDFDKIENAHLFQEKSNNEAVVLKSFYMPSWAWDETDEDGEFFLYCCDSFEPESPWRCHDGGEFINTVLTYSDINWEGELIECEEILAQIQGSAL